MPPTADEGRGGFRPPNRGARQTRSKTARVGRAQRQRTHDLITFVVGTRAAGATAARTRYRHRSGRGVYLLGPRDHGPEVVRRAEAMLLRTHHHRRRYARHAPIRGSPACRPLMTPLRPRDETRYAYRLTTVNLSTRQIAIHCPPKLRHVHQPRPLKT
jgi:hypothetical protein